MRNWNENLVTGNETWKTLRENLEMEEQYEQSREYLPMCVCDEVEGEVTQMRKAAT